MMEQAVSVIGLVVLFVLCLLALSGLMSLAPSSGHSNGNVNMNFDCPAETVPYQREWLKPKTPVKFDPHNKEHLAALALIRLHGRLHPTLRFEFNPAKHDNAYDGMLDMVLIELVLKPDVRALAEKALDSTKIKKTRSVKRVKTVTDLVNTNEERRIHLIAKG